MTIIQEYSRREHIYGTRRFRFVVTDTYEELFIPSWSASGSYATDDVVFYNGQKFKALSPNVNTAPDQTPIAWELQTTLTFTVWDNATTYNPGDVVKHVNTLYRAIEENLNSQPPSNSWQKIESSYTVDIFDVSPTKEKLSGDDGSYKADELSFTVDQAACKTEAKINALQFCLEAGDIERMRYVAKFCDVDYSSEETIQNTCMFLGKLPSKWDGNDTSIANGRFSSIIDPSRKYSFQATSFDVSVFGNLKMKQMIEKEDGTKIRPVLCPYDASKAMQWSASINFKSGSYCYILDGSEYKYFMALEDNSNKNPLTDPDKDNIWFLVAAPRLAPWTVSALFEDKLMYKFGRPDVSQLANFDMKFYKLGKLFNCLHLLCASATQAIQEITGEAFEIVLNPVDLAFEVCPVEFKQSTEHHSMLKEGGVYDYVTAKKPLRFDNVDSDDFYIPWVHRSVFDSRLIDEDNGKYTFFQYDTFIEAIAAVARALGCYPMIAPKTNKQIHITLTPQATIPGDEIFIADWIDGKKEIESYLESEKTIYKGYANALTYDGFSELPTEKETEENSATLVIPLASKEVELAKEKDKDKENNDSLLLSTSFPMATQNTSSFAGYGSGVAKTSYLPLNCYSLPVYNGAPLPVKTYRQKEIGLNALFIQTPPLSFEQSVYAGTMDKIFWRPVGRVYAEIDGKPIEDSQGNEGALLSEFVNKLFGRTKFAYNTKYSITVPFLSGFSSASDGSNPKWNLIQLGSKITFTETNRKVFNNTTQKFEAVTDNITFLVKGIERDENKLETRLELENIRNYLIAPQTTQPQGLVYNGSTNSQALTPEETVQGVSEDIVAGNYVMMNASGEGYVKAINHSSYFNLYEGIALTNPDSNGLIRVQREGDVVNDAWNFSGKGKQVFLRINNSGYNISESLLTAATAKASMNDAELTDEDAIVVIGETTGTKSFKLYNPPKLKYYSQGVIDNA